MPAAALVLAGAPALQLPPDTSVPVFPPYAWALLCPFGLSRMCCFPPHAWAHGHSAALSILPNPRQKELYPTRGCTACGAYKSRIPDAYSLS